MTSSVALELRASYLTSVVTSLVVAVRCGLLGNSALNPASVALKTVGLSALLVGDPPQATSSPISSTKAATGPFPVALRGASGPLPGALRAASGPLPGALRVASGRLVF